MAKILYQDTTAGAESKNIVASPPTDRKIVVDSMTVSVTAAAIVTFEEDAGTDVVLLVLDFAGAGAIHLPGPHVLHTDALGADLLVTNSAGNASVTVLYREVPWSL